MMARGGDPNLNWIEDQVIVAALRLGFDPPKGELQDFATVQSFLEKRFPDLADGRIEEFIKTVNRVRSDYLLLLMLSTKGQDVSRIAARKKYKQLLGSLMDFHRAFAASVGAPWELIRHIDCHGRPSEGSPMRGRFDALDFDRFNEQLMGLTSTISKIIRCLKGTAQDRTRPERFLVHELWSKWVDLGFPEPTFIRGADARDADAPDEDAFAETVRLVFDVMYADSKLIDGEVTYQLRTIIEEGRKKLHSVPKGRR
jgi:hypothetical protein